MNFIVHAAVVHSDCYKTPQVEQLQQLILISHSSGGWKSDHGAHSQVPVGSSSYWLADGCLLTVAEEGQRDSSQLPLKTSYRY